MKNFDYRPHGLVSGQRLARTSEGGNHTSTFYRNCCAKCGKTFNKRKGRDKALAVTLPSGYSGFACGQCVQVLK